MSGKSNLPLEYRNELSTIAKRLTYRLFCDSVSTRTSSADPKWQSVTNRIRGTLTAICLLLFVIRMPLGSILLLFVWIGVETFFFCRRFGRRGYVAYSCIVAATVSFVSFQGYVLWSNFQLIAEIEARGASRAAMSGTLLPGDVNYISLGSDVGDDELAKILALDGLENLEYIVADGSQITDSGLLRLRRFDKLEHIYVSGADITGDGIGQLQRALPGCLIVFDPDR